jgi:hypothetical protein
MVYPKHGDVFYLRALLAHRSAHGWEELRTVDGEIFGTYQEAARALGLFTDHNEGLLAFRELLNLNSHPSQLRWLFAVLASEGDPVISLWDEYELELSADIRDSMMRSDPDPDPTIVRNQTLMAIQDLLRGLGKQMTDVGLPELHQRCREVEAEIAKWTGDPGNLSSFAASLTPEQV